MAIGSTVSGDVKSASNLYAKVNGGWKKAQFGYVKVAGTWRQFWAAEIKDTFSRGNFSSLGNAETGQAWSVLRGQWTINNNAAKATSAKSEYPLAYIDGGFSNAAIEASELTPGTGVAFRVQDANNWYAVMPYYNQTAENYTYCANFSAPYQVCTCTETYQSGTGCSGPTSPVVTQPVVVGCSVALVTSPDRYVVTEGQPCSMVGVPVTTIENVCVNTCIKFGTKTTCVQVAVPGTGVYLGSTLIPVRYTQQCTTSDICLYKDLVCTNQAVTRTVQQYQCTQYQTLVPGSTYCPAGQEIIQQQYVSGGDCLGTTYPIYSTRCPCNQYTQQRDCLQFAVGTTYTNFYYVRVVKMVNGVFSVVSDTQVSSRWNAIKFEVTNANLNAVVYSDSLYTQTVGTATVIGGINNVVTGYGVASMSSNFEDGTTIGSLSVTPLGQ